MIQNAQIQILLAARGKVGVPLLDYALLERTDGQGPQVAEWNAATLGPLPTQAELDAITPAQIAAFDTARRTAAFTATSRQKDILAMVALVVRARGIPAWNALSTPQKVTATLAEADVWATIREFVETNT